MEFIFPSALFTITFLYWRIYGYMLLPNDEVTVCGMLLLGMRKDNVKKYSSFLLSSTTSSNLISVTSDPKGL